MAREGAGGGGGGGNIYINILMSRVLVEHKSQPPCTYLINPVEKRFRVSDAGLPTCLPIRTNDAF